MRQALARLPKIEATETGTMALISVAFPLSLKDR